MVLDSEEQKNYMLQVIAATPIQGPYQAISDTIDALKALETAVKMATIEEPK